MNGSLAAMPATTRAPESGWRDGWRSGLSYGALGLPLAFVALPLYVVLPNHYAEAFGVPLAWLGALLLAARLLDAVVDPWIGRRCDAWFSRSTPIVLRVCVLAALALALGFVALFFPPMRDLPGLLLWCYIFRLGTPHCNRWRRVFPACWAMQAREPSSCSGR